jgi:hypothetical protein
MSVLTRPRIRSIRVNVYMPRSQDISADYWILDPSANPHQVSRPTKKPFGLRVLAPLR